MSLLERRAFIAQSLKAAGALSVLTIPGSSMAAPRDFTVQQIIDSIIKEVPNAPFKQTVDTIKAGSADQKVTGIVTTMFATIPVIQQTARLGANFIIAHEPTFYNHTDDPNWAIPNNSIVEQKQALLKQHGIAVWRFHDYWHSIKPDGISYGVAKMAGWEQYYKTGEWVHTIPATTLQAIALNLKSKLGISHIKVIGDLSQSCQRILLIPGAAGGQMQISMVEKEKPDVLIVGEVHEWETAEYIRDARQLGSKTALIILGHSVSEEPGMEWLIKWLQPKVPGLKITHVPSGDPFTWM